MTGGRQPLAVTSGPRPPGTVDTQNARIRTASIVTGIEPESAQSGGSRALATARDHDAVLWRLSNVSDLIADSALTWLTCGRTFPATQKCRFGAGRIDSARLAAIMLLI